MDLGIESVLVAGRGPAACSVTAACSRLGIKAGAVHSAAGGNARPARLADDAVELGPAPAAEAYLAVDRIVEAARRSGARAVLPVPPALAGNARDAGGGGAGGLTSGGPPGWPVPGGGRVRWWPPASPGWAPPPRSSSGWVGTVWSRPASAGSSP